MDMELSSTAQGVGRTHNTTEMSATPRGYVVDVGMTVPVIDFALIIRICRRD